MFYAVGSLLFAVTLVAALAVIATSLRQYWTQMIAALRMLSLDGVVPPAAPPAKAVAPGIRRPVPRALAA